MTSAASVAVSVTRLVLVGIAIYAAIVALVYVFQDRLLYFPQYSGAMAGTPAQLGLPYDDVTLQTSDGERLNAWWIPVAQARGAALLLHGNAGNISHRLPYAVMFRELGYATLLVDYRGYGKSTGRPSEEGTYRDATAAWLWLTRTRGLAPQDVVIFGESLGGAVACWLAAANPPRALVLASTFTSLPDVAAEVYRFLPIRWMSRYQYDTRNCVRRVHAPVLVIHSRNDEIIPFHHGEKLYAVANEPKAFLEIAGGHNDSSVVARAEWRAELGKFLASTIR